MFLALWDYICFKRQRGKYNPNYPGGLMKNAFTESLPPEVERILKPGDIIFFRGGEHWLSWLVMYITDSDISHVAVYVGSSQIVHATTSGSVQEDIRVLYGRNNSLLPVTPPLEAHDRDAFKQVPSNVLGIPYGWRGVLRQGYWRIAGRDWPNFRWRFAFDLISVLSVVGYLLYFFTDSKILFIGTPGAYAALLALNYIMWRITPIPPSLSGSPGDGFVSLRLAGFRAIFNSSKYEFSGSDGVICLDMYVFIDNLNEACFAQWCGSVEKDGIKIRTEKLPEREAIAECPIRDGAKVLIQQRSARDEIIRLGITKDFSMYSECIRFDCDADINSVIVMVQLLASLVKIQRGLIYNPLDPSSHIDFSTATEWATRLVDRLQRGAQEQIELLNRMKLKPAAKE